MKSSHTVYINNAAKMDALPDACIDLVVTSPPYPMIEMWDGVFSHQDETAADALNQQAGMQAFEAMHRVLDAVWQEAGRVLKPGGIACINIGDATRTLNGHFAVYPNHSRILSAFQALGFTILPAILWRKQTNAPNKFMGSGMMPPGAYVTLEHEYVLILRKGNRRLFTTAADKQRRRESAFFWEERNQWFSDVWMGLKGAAQHLGDAKTRTRSGAFPFELPYRLISMFSVKGDTVLDPFLGVGTTMAAAMAAGRSSVGYELDHSLWDAQHALLSGIVPFARRRIAQRLEGHVTFVCGREAEKGPLGYVNRPYGFPVVTRQETDLLLDVPSSVRNPREGFFEMTYSETPALALGPRKMRSLQAGGCDGSPEKSDPGSRQRSLFE